MRRRVLDAREFEPSLKNVFLFGRISKIIIKEDDRSNVLFDKFFRLVFFLFLQLMGGGKPENGRQWVVISKVIISSLRREIAPEGMH